MAAPTAFSAGEIHGNFPAPGTFQPGNPKLGSSQRPQCVSSLNQPESSQEFGCMSGKLLRAQLGAWPQPELCLLAGSEICIDSFITLKSTLQRPPCSENFHIPAKTCGSAWAFGGHRLCLWIGKGINITRELFLQQGDLPQGKEESLKCQRRQKV